MACVHPKRLRKDKTLEKDEILRHCCNIILDALSNRVGTNDFLIAQLQPDLASGTAQKRRSSKSGRKTEHCPS